MSSQKGHPITLDRLGGRQPGWWDGSWSHVQLLVATGNSAGDVLRAVPVIREEAHDPFEGGALTDKPREPLSAAQTRELLALVGLGSPS